MICYIVGKIHDKYQQKEKEKWKWESIIGNIIDGLNNSTSNSNNIINNNNNDDTIINGMTVAIL